MSLGYYLLCTALVSSLVLAAPPPDKRRQMGPCVGMDCLHGVLMHGDEEMGDDHKNEDLYKRLEQADAERQQKRPAGPCHGQDCMELINHGPDDPDAVHRMSQKIGPEPKKQPATVDTAKAQHDGKDGNYPAKKEDATNTDKGQKAPTRESDTEDKSGNGFDAVDGRQPSAGDINVTDKKEAGPAANIAAVIHGGQNVNHSAPVTPMEGQINKEPSHVDPEKVLHGGRHVDHRASGQPAKTVDGQRAVVADLEKALHGDDKVHHNVPDQNPETLIQNDSEETTGGADHIIHGTDHAGHGRHQNVHLKKTEHHEEHSGTLDPHALLHGQRAIDPGSPDQKEAKDEEKNEDTITNDNNAGAGDGSDDNSEVDKEDSGFTFPYISDTILNEIELLKRRYLPRFWSDEDETEDIDGEEDGRVEDDASNEEATSKQSESREDGDNEIKLISQEKHLPRENNKQPETINRQERRVEI